MLEIVCHVWQWSLGNWSYFQVEGKVEQTPVRKPLYKLQSYDVFGFKEMHV